jgi:hypothetical protein
MLAQAFNNLQPVGAAGNNPGRQSRGYVQTAYAEAVREGNRAGRTLLSDGFELETSKRGLRVHVCDSDKCISSPRGMIDNSPGLQIWVGMRNRSTRGRQAEQVYQRS